VLSRIHADPYFMASKSIPLEAITNHIAEIELEPWTIIQRIAVQCGAEDMKGDMKRPCRESVAQYLGYMWVAAK